MNLDNKIKPTKAFESLPLYLTVTDIANLLGMSKGKAYELIHSKCFPSVIIGRKIIIPKPAFIKWLDNPNYYVKEI